jgi:hypothetical protein
LNVAVVFPAVAKVEHAIAGTIEKVDKETKTLVVKTVEGTEETIKWTGRTTVDGLKVAAKATDLAGREGEHVIVHYSVEGADKTALGIKHLGQTAPKVTEGTIKSIGRGSRDVVVKTREGAEETFHVADRAAVDSSKGIARGTASAAKAGEHVTVYYTEQAGRKVAHLIKRL